MVISPLIIKKGMIIYYHSPEGELNGKAINLLLIYAESCQFLHHRAKKRGMMI